MTTVTDQEKKAKSKMGRNPFLSKHSGVSTKGKVLNTAPVHRKVEKKADKRLDLWDRGESLAAQTAWYVYFAKGLVLEFGKSLTSEKG
jgi:hypothetical protein